MSVFKKSVAVAATLLMALSLTLVGCGSSATAKDPAPSGTTEADYTLVTPGTLTIGSDCDYPPFVYMEGDQAAGFEYELMQAMGEEMGLQVEYLAPQNFDTLISSVAAGTKMDIGVSSFTITDERKELVDFCDPYFDSNQAVVCMKDKGYKAAAELDGKTVGSQSGTTGSDWARENLPKSTLKEYNQTSDGLAALVAGDIEALIFDEPVAAEQVTKTYTDSEIIEVIPTGEQYGIAVAKENSKLKDAINAAFQTLLDNGKYAEIFANYFDFEPTIK